MLRCRVSEVDVCFTWLLRHRQADGLWGIENLAILVSARLIERFKKPVFITIRDWSSLSEVIKYFGLDCLTEGRFES